MVKDAEAHAADDKAQREQVEARIRAEQEEYAKSKAAAAGAADAQNTREGDVREGEVVDA